MDKRKLLEKHFFCRYQSDGTSKAIAGNADNYINLKLFTCNKDVLQENQLEYYLDFEFIPFRKEGKKVCVVTHKITDELFGFLRRFYKNGFKVFLSSQNNIVLSIQRNFSSKILSETINKLKVRDSKFSAHYLFSFKTKIYFFTLLLSVFLLCAYHPVLFLNIILILGNVVFFVNTLFKLVLFFVGRQKEKHVNTQEIHTSKLPKYSVIVPLYKEDHSLPHLIKSLKALEYPRDKLEVIFIVEQFDRRTLGYIRRQKDNFYRVICVPRGGPQTKPKACSYVLNYIKGDFLVIYDAEDKPDPKQILKAVQKFKSGSRRLACLQGKLNFYNSSENILTSLFSIECFVWFNLFLKGLLKLRMPIPLGGSSNHFRVEALKEVGGWDPYNVTEDADLVYRLFKKGYKSDILDSLTLEEAPYDIRGWLNQRIRWIKGHLQTYFVHIRTNRLFRDNLGTRALLGFHLFLFFPIVSYVFQIIFVFLVFNKFNLVVLVHTK